MKTPSRRECPRSSRDENRKGLRGSDGTEAVDISALGKKLEGAFVMHNHPAKETEFSFSDGDYDEFISRSLGARRGVDYKYSYELTAFKASNKKYLSQIISAPANEAAEDFYRHSRITQRALEDG